MEHEKSLLSKILITVVLPVALIFLITAGISMIVVGQNFSQFSGIQNNIILINAVGLAAIIGVITLGLRQISNKVSNLAIIAQRLVIDDNRGTSQIEKNP
nr:hypothetical protein [uncultured Acetobacterium sp.]